MENLKAAGNALATIGENIDHEFKVHKSYQHRHKNSEIQQNVLECLLRKGTLNRSNNLPLRSSKRNSVATSSKK